jgi:hypothetical protein
MFGLDTVLGGGLLGLLGSAFTAYTNYKNKQAELADKDAQRKHELELIKANTAATIEEAKAQMEIVKTQVAGAIDLEETGAYRDSIKEGNKSILSMEWLNKLLDGNAFEKVIGSMLLILLGFAEFFKDIMRPTLTTYLMGVTTWLTIKSWALVEKTQGSALTITEAMNITRDVTQAVIFLTVSSVTWWFADRQAQKFIQQRINANK